MGGSKHAREVIQDIVPVRVKRVADPRAVLEDTRQGFHRYQPRLVQCLGARQIVCPQEPKLAVAPLGAVLSSGHAHSQRSSACVWRFSSFLILAALAIYVPISNQPS